MRVKKEKKKGVQRGITDTGKEERESGERELKGRQRR